MPINMNIHSVFACVLFHFFVDVECCCAAVWLIYVVASSVVLLFSSASPSSSSSSSSSSHYVFQMNVVVVDLEVDNVALEEDHWLCVCVCECVWRVWLVLFPHCDRWILCFAFCLSFELTHKFISLRSVSQAQSRYSRMYQTMWSLVSTENRLTWIDVNRQQSAQPLIALRQMCAQQQRTRSIQLKRDRSIETTPKITPNMTVDNTENDRMRLNWRHVVRLSFCLWILCWKPQKINESDGDISE